MLNWFKKTLLGGPTAASQRSANRQDEVSIAAPKSEPRPQRQAPSKGIAFDPDLIHRLKADHRALLSTYAAIHSAAQDGRWTEVEALLRRFRAALTDHLMLESIKLYVYLQLTLASDRDNLSLMRRFSTEMVGIGKVVMDFVDDNQTVSADPARQEGFVDEWREIGKTLGDRVAREEETLYPMYEAGEKIHTTG